jgi:F0F1-type ATP synthase assembly protein I
MTNNKQQQKQHQKLKNNINTFAKYSGLAFEMVFIIGAGVFGGIKLDQVFNTSPIFTVILSFIGVILAIYFAVKDLLRKS